MTLHDPILDPPAEPSWSPISDLYAYGRRAADAVIVQGGQWEDLQVALDDGVLLSPAELAEIAHDFAQEVMILRGMIAQAQHWQTDEPGLSRYQQAVLKNLLRDATDAIWYAEDICLIVADHQQDRRRAAKRQRHQRKGRRR